MHLWQLGMARAAWLAAHAALAPLLAQACTLELREHRSERPVARIALDQAAPRFSIAFEHSVLGTTVVDTYAVRNTAGAHSIWLTEERFSGEGYGLPYSALAPHEALQREQDGWRLTLNRLVNPLVVRPLPAQQMRLVVATQTWRLADWGINNQQLALEFVGSGCTSNG